MKVLAINGSPRPDGNTAYAIGLVLGQLELQGIETEVIQVGGKPFRGCVGCGGCSQTGRCVIDDGLNELADKMEEADGILVGTPVYYAGINGTLKCFLDRAFYSRGSKMRHKVGAGLAAVRRTGGMTALADIEHFFTISEMLIPASNYWNVIHGRAKGEAQQDVEGRQVMETLGRNMAWLLAMRQQGLATAPEYQKKQAMNFIR